MIIAAFVALLGCKLIGVLLWLFGRIWIATIEELFWSGLE
jgi:hypothetical protein